MQTGQNKLVSESNKEIVIIPDEAIYYIVSNYLQSRSANGSSVVLGVSTQTVEEILKLLVSWADKNGHIKNGVVEIGMKS